MDNFSEADTIRILVATDNHVGFEERDAIRKDDSWRTFDEIINIARTEEVDMVLLAGDLFHDSKPSRKSLYQVMRTLRQNCLGMKPCPLEFLSDAASVFEGAFTHVNYEDPDINVSIPVFSIHGNHDDPSGDGNLCSLDLLQTAGLLNYFGRVAEADNIEVKPILLQKGLTKLALFGLSNVRDERIFRTFRDHKVKWYRPQMQMDDWFNMLAVHQNHYAHTSTSYLPEGVLPDWLDLVVWGHEHECLIDPTRNPDTGFHVMQPGSSVATSLVPGEAVQKHVAIVSLLGKDFKVNKVPLRTVRPFVTRELVLAQDSRFKGLAQKKENRQDVTRRLMEVVDEMIEEATSQWNSIQTDSEFLEEQPLPLIRLKVEYTAPEGGEFECENPQRFSSRFLGKVANTSDIVYFFRKKTSRRKASAAMPDNHLGSLGNGDETVKVESLVQDFLSAQSLKVLPQGPFTEAVNQFVAKDDKHAMEIFVSEHLSGQVKQMLDLETDDEDLNGAMDVYKTKIEKQLEMGIRKQRGERKRVLRPRPDTWDSDFDGNWEDEPDAWTYNENTVNEAAISTRDLTGNFVPSQASERSKFDNLKNIRNGRTIVEKPTRKAASRAANSVRKSSRDSLGNKSHATSRGRQLTADGEENEDEDRDSDDGLKANPGPRSSGRYQTRARGSTASTTKLKGGTAGTPKTRQTTLSFASQRGTREQAMERSEDEISNDDAFEPVALTTRSRR